MYSASDLFKKAISQKARDLRIRVTIDGRIYKDSEVQDCSVEESILTGDDFKFGSATASRLDLTLLNMGEALTAKSFEGKEAHIEIGVMLDKFSQPFEFVSTGFFTIEEAIKANNLIKLTGYDKMIFFEKPYVSSLTYPVTLKQILQEVCAIAGVELHTTSFINDTFLVDTPELTNVTLRNALEFISELSCSFASINRNGKLELVTLKQTDTIINADNYYSMNLSEYEYGPIEEISFSSGNIFAVNADQQVKDNMLNAVRGFKFKPFTATWQGNPLTAPGDIISVSNKKGDVHQSFIAKQKFTFATGLKCDLQTNAKTAIRKENESPGPISKVVESTRKEMRSKFEQVEDRITLEVEAVNESIAAIELKADSITLSVASMDSRIGNAEASLSIQAGQISSKVERDGIISAFNQSPETIKLQASKIELVGAVSVLSDITGNLGTVTGGTLIGIDWRSVDNATPFNVYVGAYPAMKVYNGSLRLIEDGNEFCYINKNGLFINGQPVSGGGPAKFG